MTLVVKSSNEQAISLPAWLMQILNLREGDQVKPIVNGQSLYLAHLDQFLSLRGALADDPAFDQAMDYIDQAWKSWTTPVSV